MARINHTICVCIHRQTSWDRYLADEANGGQARTRENSCGYWFLLVSLFSTLHCIPLGNNYLFMGLLVFVQGKKKEKNNIWFYFSSILEYLFSFSSMIEYVSAFQSSILCSLVFEARVHFKAIPLRVNGWDHMGLRWFRMANPAESVISSRRHQFGVWNRGPGEPDSLRDSWKEQRGLGISSHTPGLDRNLTKRFKYMKQSVKGGRVEETR